MRPGARYLAAYLLGALTTGVAVLAFERLGEEPGGAGAREAARREDGAASPEPPRSVGLEGAGTAAPAPGAEPAGGTPPASPTPGPGAPAVGAEGPEPATALPPPRGGERPRPGEGAVDLLRRLLVSGRGSWIERGLAADGEAVAALVARRHEGPTWRPEEVPAEAPIPDGTTILLEAGVHDFSAFADRHRGRFPADLTFRGAGMDRTLLVLSEIGPSGAVENLAFEDLTIDSRGHHFADVRGDEPVAMRLARVRVVGFDSGPAAAAMVAARSLAFTALASRFEGGYGAAPGKGSLFHVRGPLLVRLEDCVVRGPLARVVEPSRQASYAFVGCRFEAIPEALRREMESPPPEATFERCTFDYREPPAADAAPRPLAELNPDWR